MKWLLVVEVVGIIGMTLASFVAFGAPVNAPKISHGVGHSVGLYGSPQIVSRGAR
ncbi:MAG: hypothetical protein ABSD38_11735 [Syntrophorhabdales bacterium]|jgi:hypothetical protein